MRPHLKHLGLGIYGGPGKEKAFESVMNHCDQVRLLFSIIYLDKHF